jgi:hypothetical protein
VELSPEDLFVPEADVEEQCEFASELEESIVVWTRTGPDPFEPVKPAQPLQESTTIIRLGNLIDVLDEI